MQPIHQKLTFALACVGVLNLHAATVVKPTSEPSTASRTIEYHESDIAPIYSQIRFTTLIQLPRQETITAASCGDQEFWRINYMGNLAYVKSAKVGARTNVNLITASGNSYSFLVSEVSNVGDAHADLKVFVNPADRDAVTAMTDKPRYVSADQVEGYKKTAETATAQLEAEQAAAAKQLEKAKTELQANYPTTIKHDYKYTVGPKNPFNVSAIFHDDRFTYIDAVPEETPAVYEIKDRKPSLIEYQFKDGRYTIPKIVNDGLLRVGKAELKFKRG